MDLYTSANLRVQSVCENTKAGTNSYNKPTTKSF